MSKAKLSVDESKKYAKIIMPTCELQTIIDVKDVKVYDSTRGVVDFAADFFATNKTFDFNDIKGIIGTKRPEMTVYAKEEWHLIDKAEDNA